MRTQILITISDPYIEHTPDQPTAPESTLHRTCTLTVFRTNTEHYPASANTWDSLGEAYLTKGDLDAAESHYRRALELDPDSANAERMLARIAGRR